MQRRKDCILESISCRLADVFVAKTPPQILDDEDVESGEDDNALTQRVMVTLTTTMMKRRRQQIPNNFDWQGVS